MFIYDAAYPQKDYGKTRGHNSINTIQGTLTFAFNQSREVVLRPCKFLLASKPSEHQIYQSVKSGTASIVGGFHALIPGVQVSVPHLRVTAVAKTGV